MRLPRGCRGFTLAEVVVASSITSIILLGMTSAMVVAAHAAPGRTGLTELTLQAGRATDQLSADVAAATSFSILGAGSIEMTVPDRTGDGLNDTIRYAWSGTSGASLNRIFNNGSAVAVANDVRQFNLGYVKSAIKQPTSYTESAESLIYNTDTTVGYSSFAVSDKAGVGISFLPSVPSSAAYLRITRADFLLKSSSSTSTAEVRATLRSGTSVYSISANVSDYSKVYAPTVASSWIEATFPQKVQLSPNKAVAITLSNMSSSGDFAAGLRTGVSIVNSALCYTSDSGNSWSADAGRTLPAYVYAVYGTKNADAYLYNLTQVTCVLKCGNSSIAQIRSDMRAINSPQVSGP